MNDTRLILLFLCRHPPIFFALQSLFSIFQTARMVKGVVLETKVALHTLTKQCLGTFMSSFAKGVSIATGIHAAGYIQKVPPSAFAPARNGTAVLSPLPRASSKAPCSRETCGAAVRADWLDMSIGPSRQSVNSAHDVHKSQDALTQIPLAKAALLLALVCASCSYGLV